jgi:ribonuclease HI
MPSGKKQDLRVLKSFLEELKRTLDLKKTIERLGMTDSEARDLIASLQLKLKLELKPKLKLSEQKLAAKAPFFSVYVDGASRGNPGRAGAGAVIKDADGKVIKRMKKGLGITTNNMAEYRALIMGLEEAKRLGLDRVKVFADSELVVKQIKGEYRVKNETLRPLYSEALDLADGFEGFNISYITRDKNAEADRLANMAIDRGEELPDMV